MKALFILLPMIMAVCAVILLINASNIPYAVITAYRLEDKPEKSFIIIDADPALLDAISNPAKHVRANSLLDDTQIDNLIAQHNTSNIEYQNSYYRIDIAMVDNASAGAILVLSALIVLVISTTLFAALIGLKIAHYFRRKQ